MAGGQISTDFLDELRARTTLSTLIGRSIKVSKAGREHKACCPFHNEKTPSFTINDDKGFYHCFGCGAHGDAIRWMTDQRGLPFIDAVRELADAAGMEMPARTPEQAQREEARASAASTLDRAADWYARQLNATPAALTVMHARGVDDAAIARFGLGLAPSRQSVTACGAPLADLTEAGLLLEVDNGFRDRFRGRFMIPIHDHRGRIAGFGARAGREGQEPKFLNSPQSETGVGFDKGRLLYNLHRAAEPARKARRLIIVEGYFDVIAMDGAGYPETVAPMGTAITPAQLERAWRVAKAPVMMLDGDAAGRKAALRAATTALPFVGPRRTLRFAMLPEGKDPDDLIHTDDGGRDAIEALLTDALALADFVWQACLGDAESGGHLLTPEGKAALWARLAGLAATIAEPETREQYLADWRARFDAAFPPPPAWARDIETLPHGRPSALFEQAEAVQTVLRSDADAWLARKIEQWNNRRPTRDHLLRAAFKGGRRVGAGLLTREALSRELTPHVERIDGLELSDVDKPIDRGIGRPWDIGPDVQTLNCRSYPMTDFGIAEMFVAVHGQNFTNTTAKGWLGWDGRRWKVLDQDKDGPPPAELQAAIIDTIRRYQDIARLVRASGAQSDDNPDGLDRLIPKGRGQELLSAAIARFGRASETAGKPASIAKLVQRWLTRPIEDFDRDPFAVNVMNGTLKFRRLEFDGRTSAVLERCSHDRADMITHLAPAEYDPSAESPIFDEFLEWAHPSAPVRRYLSQVFGYTMTGDTGEQKLWFHYGKGGNGKSVFFDIIAFVLGDYAGSIGIETFLDQGIKKRGDAATPDLARLGGVRFLRTSEPERGARLNEALIKAATGGEPMPVRALHRGFFDLTPAFKPHIAGNYRPDIPGTDEGIWRRMKLVPWGEHRAENARDPHLVDKMKREGGGVLRWMVGGLLDWLENGLVEPDAVKVATEAYRDDTDPLGQFIAMCIEPAPGERVQSSVLHEVYSAWCQSAGERVWKPNGFADAMRERGFEKKKSNGIKWLDIRLKRSVDDFIDPDGRVRLLPDDQDRPAATPADGDDDDYVPGFD